MMTDPIADMLTRIRNALLMRQEQTVIPYSRLKEACVKIFQKEGFLKSFEVLGEKHKKSLVVGLKYSGGGKPAFLALHRISKPGRRVYLGYQDLKPLRHGMGVRLLTTSKGVLSDQEARAQKLGGEILMEVW